jgi:hypothetical protein
MESGRRNKRKKVWSEQRDSIKVIKTHSIRWPKGLMELLIKTSDKVIVVLQSLSILLLVLYILLGCC